MSQNIKQNEFKVSKISAKMYKKVTVIKVNKKWSWNLVANKVIQYLLHNLKTTILT